MVEDLFGKNIVKNMFIEIYELDRCSYYVKCDSKNYLQDLLDCYESYKFIGEINKDLDKLEIKPLYEGILIKPYAENPFQQIKKEGAIIVDLGGQKPIYKSHEDGEYHEEKQFVKVGLVVEVGPTTRYIKEGDVVMWR